MEKIMRNFEYFDARAQDVNLDDITSSSRNAQILRDLRDGETAWKGAHLEVWELDPDEESGDENYDDYIDYIYRSFYASCRPGQSNESASLILSIWRATEGGISMFVSFQSS